MIAALGIVLLDIVMCFILAKIGMHGVSVDLRLFSIEVTPNFVAVIFSAALIALKTISWNVLIERSLLGWDIVQAKKNDRMHTAMVLTSILCVLINVPFLGYYMQGMVGLDGSPLECVFVPVIVLSTMSEAPQLVRDVIRSLRHRK